MTVRFILSFGALLALPGTSCLAQLRVAPVRAPSTGFGPVGAGIGVQGPASPSSFGAPALASLMRSGIMGGPSMGLPEPAGELIARDPETGVYGLTAEKSRAMVEVLKKHYGDDLLDLAVIGSRAEGKSNAMKGFRPVRPSSDLDLVPLIRNNASGRVDCRIIGEELKKLLGFSVEVHTVLSFDGNRFDYAVPFYGGGGETYHHFGSGEAVRVPID